MKLKKTGTPSAKNTKLLAQQRQQQQQQDRTGRRCLCAADTEIAAAEPKQPRSVSSHSTLIAPAAPPQPQRAGGAMLSSRLLTAMLSSRLLTDEAGSKPEDMDASDVST